MKLRQKLAIVLASAMIVASVPVVTMAASENTFNKTISIVADAAVTTNQGLSLDVKYTTDNTGSDVFYVTAQDFEFEKAAYDHELEDGTIQQGTVVTSGYEVKYISKTELEVTVNNAAGKVSVPVAGTPKKGTPALIVDGRDSFVTSGTYALSGEVTTTKTLVATAAEAKNISIEGNGTIADIIIEEKVAEQLSGEEITITLPNNSDLVFASNQAVTLKGQRGLSAVAADSATVNVVDEKEIKVTMPEITSTRAGAVAIQGIKVAPENPREDVSTGDVNVTVEAKNLEDTKLTVAKVADYAVTMNVEEVATLTSGQGTETVKVTIEETTAGSLGNKPVYLTMEGAQFVGITTTAGITLNADKDEITLEPVQNATKAQKYELEFEISTKAAQAGDITLVAEGRGLEKEIELKIAEAKAPITVETETFYVEPGIKEQTGGKIVITETEAGKLGKKEIVIKTDDKDLKIEAADVKVTAGDIKVKSDTNKDGELVLTVERTSDEASEITIENLEVTASKVIADGGYDLLIGGFGISDMNKNDKEDKFADVLTVEDFMVVGDVQAEGEATFTVGKATFIHNGEEKAMDVAPYITAKNRVMIPVRFLSEAFGIAQKDILFADGTVTMFRGKDIIQLQNGSNFALLNGVKIPMEETMTIKDDRAFVPMGEIARILNVDVQWDNTAKTATFSN